MRLRVILALVALIIAVAAVLLSDIVKQRTGASVNPCIANLKQIDAAKEIWASENQVTNLTVEVRTSDLYGRTKYIYDVPSCPSNDTYIIGTLGEKPRCTVPGHTF